MLGGFAFHLNSLFCTYLDFFLLCCYHREWLALGLPFCSIPSIVDGKQAPPKFGSFRALSAVALGEIMACHSTTYHLPPVRLDYVQAPYQLVVIAEK
jgi:hypothetical protein